MSDTSAWKANSVDGTSRTLAFCSKAIHHKRQEPVHSEACNCDTLFCPFVLGALWGALTQKTSRGLHYPCQEFSFAKKAGKREKPQENGVFDRANWGQWDDKREPRAH